MLGSRDVEKTFDKNSTSTCVENKQQQQNHKKNTPIHQTLQHLYQKGYSSIWERRSTDTHSRVARDAMHFSYYWRRGEDVRSAHLC